MGYQGKFSSNNRKPRFSDEETLVTSRKAAATENETYRDAAPVKRAPKKETYQDEAPVKKTAKKSSRKKKKANRTVTIIFYTVYFLLIIGFLAGLYFVNDWLNEWLVDYESSQPTTMCEEVFDRLFADPDWATVYDLAGIEDSVFEGVDEYVSYMESKVGSAELTYAETSAGLSGGHKYLIKLESETLGHFLLEDLSEGSTDLPDWQLTELSMNVSRNNSVLIQSMEGHTVTVNGVELDDSYVVRISTTLAEEYLPTGVSGLSTQMLQVDGLMSEPQVTITDETGAASTVVYNEETGIYEEQTAANTIGSEEQEFAQKAAETYGLYMIKEANYTVLAKYFNASSDIFKTITGMQLWMQTHYGYEFANQEVSEYCRYSDDVFSARVSLDLNVKRSDGSVKEYTVDSTFFFQKMPSGWKCYDMTNVDVQAPISTVRLTFKYEDTVLDSNFYESDTTELEAPELTVPAGKVFSGWYKETVNADGSITYDVVFTPDENGDITLPAGTALEPMTLYPLFEDAEGGAE